MSFLPWGVILAGGEGTRLKVLSRSPAGDNRALLRGAQQTRGPVRSRQLCQPFEDKPLLARTRDMLEPAISNDRMVFSVPREHAACFRGELADIDESRIVVRPADCGTTAAIICSLPRLMRIEKDPIVAFFPSDRRVADETQFARAVDRAFDVVRRHPDLLVLVGAAAQRAGVEYGWIEPGPLLENTGPGALPVFRVERFWEKPSFTLAQTLLKSGCLWNTFVVAGRARTFLALVEATMPQAVAPFHAAASRMTKEQAWLAAQVYQRLPPSDFSCDVLTRCARRLAVVSMEGAERYDPGTPGRAYRTMRKAAGAGFAPASGRRIF